MKALSRAQIYRENYTAEDGSVKTIGLLISCGVCMDHKAENFIALDIPNAMPSREAMVESKFVMCEACVDKAIARMVARKAEDKMFSRVEDSVKQLRKIKENGDK